MNSVSITFESQEELRAFEAVLSASLKTGDIGIAKAVTHFHSKLEAAIKAANEPKHEAANETTPTRKKTST